MEIVQDLIGRPFPEKGQDGYGPSYYHCYGLAWEVYQRFGKKIPKVNVSVYACQIAQKEIDAAKTMGWQELSGPETPCVILFPAVAGFAQHIGVYIGDGNVIHTGPKLTCCIEKLYRIKHKILGYWQYDPA